MPASARKQRLLRSLPGSGPRRGGIPQPTLPPLGMRRLARPAQSLHQRGQSPVFGGGLSRRARPRHSRRDSRRRRDPVDGIPRRLPQRTGPRTGLGPARRGRAALPKSARGHLRVPRVRVRQNGRGRLSRGDRPHAGNLPAPAAQKERDVSLEAFQRASVGLPCRRTSAARCDARMAALSTVSTSPRANVRASSTARGSREWR